ncbi:MAG TPA: c-type cytochrome [Kofleriaceae bacterium]|nr:c-type cytochrome [Kofleriaceae bacterium]
MMKTALLLLTAIGCTPGDDPTENPPPPPWGVPISGGNLVVTRDGAAVIADADRDRILMIDLATQGVLGEVAVPGDEPGRVLEDGSGRVHVALRRGGALLTFTNGRSSEMLARRQICAEPRGIAWEQATDLVHVACAGGELVSLPAGGGAAVRTLRLDRDLRDVIVSGNRLVVTQFRSSQLMTIDATGSVLARTAPPTVQRFGATDFDDFGSSGLVDAVPAVAWRTIALPNNRLLVSHQRQVKGKLKVEEGGYGGGCGGKGPVESALTIVEAGLPPAAVVPFVQGALPVDLAVSPNGQLVAVATAGDNMVRTATVGTLNSRDDDKCGPGPRGPNGPGGEDDDGDDLGTPTSIAFTASNDLVIYYPESPALVVRKVTTGGGASSTIPLPGTFGYDAGRSLFHGQTAIGLACASCHPEGRDDGAVWTFEGFGTRRTQSLAGNILARGPYHWVGDMDDLGVLMDDVFANRMAGGEVTRSQRVSLGPWLDRVPTPAPVATTNLAAVERGRELFNATGCATCHSGTLFTNNRLVDVGTGGKFKVPSLLGIAARAPFMHTGCAGTLRDRFTSCGGGDAHGVTSAMAPAQIDDMVAYLESL